MQYRRARSNVPFVIWYMPTALDAGRHTSHGSSTQRQRQ
jgi:hypothetical protein